MKTREETRTAQKAQHIDLGISDSKGRAIGLWIRTWESDFVPVPDSAQTWSEIPAGHWFFATTQVSRCGISYGASQSAVRFSSAAEREKWIAIKVEVRRLATLKKFAGKGAA